MSRRSLSLSLLCTAVAVALVAGLLVYTRPPATTPAAAPLNRGTNAAWLGVEWVNEPHQPDEIALLARDLGERQIGVIYVFTSYWKSDTGFNPTYSHAAEFTQALRAAQPELSVQAWLGLPLAQSRLFGGRYRGVDLEDASLRERIVTFSVELVREHGFDGVHLDPEPIVDGNTAVLTLLDELRSGLGPGPTLSIATPRIWPLSHAMPSVAGRFFLSPGYYRKVAARVDQVALMTYDSTLPLPQLYRLWAKRQVVAVTRALEGTEVALFVGIPTSEERTWTHWPNAENMASGLHGLVDGLNDAAAVPEVVTGVAIYPYWETDAAEWATYEALWLGE